MIINTEPKRIGEGKLLAIGLIAWLGALIPFFALISGGVVRHVPITWKENIKPYGEELLNLSLIHI